MPLLRPEGIQTLNAIFAKVINDQYRIHHNKIIVIQFGLE
jgi:hypothetical protein